MVMALTMVFIFIIITKTNDSPHHKIGNKNVNKTYCDEDGFLFTTDTTGTDHQMFDADGAIICDVV